MKTNNITFNGSVNNIQIQQNTSNSEQVSNSLSINYEEIRKILQEIVKLQDDFISEFPDFKDEFCEAVSTAIKETEVQENPSKIKKALLKIKDFAINVTESLAASGILALINSINFLGIILCLEL